MTDDFLIERESDEVLLRMPPDMAEALALALASYNELRLASGLPLDSGWAELADELMAAR